MMLWWLRKTEKSKKKCLKNKTINDCSGLIHEMMQTEGGNLSKVNINVGILATIKLSKRVSVSTIYGSSTSFTYALLCRS